MKCKHETVVECIDWLLHENMAGEPMAKIVLKKG